LSLPLPNIATLRISIELMQKVSMIFLSHCAQFVLYRACSRHAPVP